MSQQKVVRQRSPEEEEIDAKQAEIGRLEEELASVEEETASFNSGLRRFEVDYSAAVGPHYLRLDRWKLRCDEIRWSINYLSRLRDTGGVPVEEEMRRERQETFRQQWDEMHESEEQESERHAYQPPPDLSEDDERELKRVYRALAKRFHPDLASTPEAKAARAEVMAKINEAYQRKDLAHLRLLSQNPDIADRYKETIGEKLVRLIREIARLKRVIAEARAALDALRQSDLAHLMEQVRQARAAGEDLLTQLAAHIQERIASMKEEWTTSRAEETALWKEVD